MEQTTSQGKPISLASLLTRADNYTRQEPTKAVVSAAGAGFLINLLPIGAIAGGLIAIGFAMVRPVLLFLGLLKAFEFLKAKSKQQDQL